VKKGPPLYSVPIIFGLKILVEQLSRYLSSKTTTKEGRFSEKERRFLEERKFFDKFGKTTVFSKFWETTKLSKSSKWWRIINPFRIVTIFFGAVVAILCST
jgi:hypothetical protein